MKFKDLKSGLMKNLNITLILLLSSCFSYSEEQPHSNANQCIEPIYGSFSYPIAKIDEEETRYPGKDFVVPPPMPWKFEAQIPEIEILDIDETRVQLINTVRVGQAKENNKVWFNISTINGESLDNKTGIYNIEDNNWEFINEQVDILFIDTKGTVWGSRYFLDSFDKDFPNGILFKFDEITNTFIPIESIKHLPIAVEYQDANYYSKVLMDIEGVFWILIPNDAIYTYSPIENKLNKISDIPFVFNDAQISTNGNIYFYINFATYESGRLNVTQLLNKFSISTYEIETSNLAYLLEPYPNATNILIDHLDRLWLDNIAYKDSEGYWYQIYRSPIFVAQPREAYNDFRYKSAKILLESSDGRLWFLHRNNGMIWLDPEKGEWCWFTTYQSNIVEDSDRNLWMIADNKLYKLPLSEQ